MKRTNIEWVKNPDGSPGYTWNPITGCLNHDNGLCKGGGFPCYAYKLANGRLKPLYLANMNCPTSVDFRNGEYKPDADAYLDPFYPRFWEERLEPTGLTGGSKRPHSYGNLKCYKDHKPKGIFVCDMGDLFGVGVPESWTQRVLDTIKKCPAHRFYLLTKQPQNLIKFSPFPDNVWVGVTATNPSALRNAVFYLDKVKAKIKYISIEPLLEDMKGVDKYEPEFSEVAYNLSLNIIDWLIIGACTGSAWDIGKVQRRYPDLAHKPIDNKWTAQPKIEWLREIVEAADKAGIKVFLKDNLMPLVDKDPDNATYFYSGYLLRQEMPE